MAVMYVNTMLIAVPLKQIARAIVQALGLQDPLLPQQVVAHGAANSAERMFGVTTL